MTLKELRAAKFGAIPKPIRRRMRSDRKRQRRHERELSADARYLLANTPPIVLERWLRGKA